MEQDTSCPTCRKSLQENKETTTQGSSTDTIERGLNRPARSRNLFQFNGSRYFRWLPNFSLQVISSNDIFGNLLRTQTVDPTRLNEMVN